MGRCALRVDGVCETQIPPVRRLPKGTAIRCHRTEQELLVAQTGPVLAASAATPRNMLYQRAE
jgi:peptide/nickel transport system ATP-binding protein